MRSLAIVVSIMFLFSCKQKHAYNHEAIKFNDSAVMMPNTMKGIQLHIHIGKDSFAKIQLALLNRATKIDSNYFIAYQNKFGIQYALKQYSDALVTGKEILRLRPQDAIFKYLVGKIYDKTGDTIRARTYYKDYLSYCDHILDTMPQSNKQLESIKLQKALVLILLNQPQQGHDILEKLYEEAGGKDKNSNPYTIKDNLLLDKDSYLLYMHLSKADLLTAKDTSITIGQKTSTINTEFP